MPMATAVRFNSAQAGFIDFQNASYIPNPEVYQSVIHSASSQQQDASRRLSSDPSIPVSAETFRGSTLVEEPYEPYLFIIEQPKSKWRYRYESEKGSHGGLPGLTSTPSRKAYPTVKLFNYNGNEQVHLKASLWTHESSPTMHVHKLFGQNCESDGTCIIKLNEDFTAVLQDVAILFVAKKYIPSILYHRKLAHHDLDSLSEEQKGHFKAEADREAKTMNLNSVTIRFEAFYYSPTTKECVSLCSPIFSEPVSNLKSPDSGDLKICRMSRSSGSVLGDEEVFLLCAKVSKKDIMVRFYENGTDWEAFGTFTEADVHYQYAIVFQTPAYHRTDIKEPVTVFLQLQRRSGEASDPREFIYVPYKCDDDGMTRKRKKTSSYQGFDRSANGLHGTFGTSDCISLGNLQSPVLDSESLNGSSLGSSSSYTGHAESLDEILSSPEVDWATIIQLDDEEMIDDSLLTDHALENACSGEIDGPLIEPNNDPLLSEANVQMPRWSGFPCGDQLDGALSFIKTDSVPSGIPMKNVKHGYLIQRVKQPDKELVHSFNKLHIVEESSMKRGTANSTSSYSVNPTVPPKKVAEVPTKKGEHFSSIGDGTASEREASQNRTFVLWMKRIWDAVSTAIKKDDPLSFPRKVQYLLQLSDEDGNTLLHLAVKHQWRIPNFVESLLKAAEGSLSIINVTNKRHLTPLHLAVKMRRLSIVKLLLQYGANPMCRDRNGCTSIHMAVNKNYTDCLYELLDHNNYKNSLRKLDLEHFNYDGLAPIHCAVKKGFVECIALLCSSAADINVSCRKDGRTPLHFAVGDVNVMKPLLKKETIDVNAQDYGGNTALHLACASKCLDVIIELVLHGANPAIQNFSDSSSVTHSGKTPLDFAAESEEIKQILKGVMDQAFKMPLNIDDRSANRNYMSEGVSVSTMYQHSDASQNSSCAGKPELNINFESHASQHDCDSGYISGCISELNEETLVKLCKLLDPPSKSWEALFPFFGIDEASLENILKLAPSSPTRAIIKIFLRDGGNIEMLIGALGAANLAEAQSVVMTYCSKY